MPQPLVPWHMWGSQQNLVSGGGVGIQSVQLARINYGRPDTWRFVIWITTQEAIILGDSALATFKVTIGVGRTSFTMDPFANLLITGPHLVPRTVWRSTIVQPNFAGAAGDNTPTSEFVAQDIQCSCDVSAALGTYHVTVGAFFAPNVHVRPEWFARHARLDEQFRGGENEAT